jgi:hypothetical protein
MLNWVPRPAIAAGETVRFEMRLDVPADRPPGATQVVWRILELDPDTDVFANADIQLVPAR